jgi:hypothetical protein
LFPITAQLAGRTVLDRYVLAMPELAESNGITKEWNAGLKQRFFVFG